MNHSKTLTHKVNQTRIDSIKLYDKNPKLHKSKQIHQICKSIDEFGFNNPILIDGNNIIIAGHGRVLAAKQLGLTEVPTITLSHLNAEQKRLYRIADNKLTENGQWDMDLLAIEFQELSNLDLSCDLEITGFETTEIDLIIDDLSSTNSSNTDDNIPEINQKPITKSGDIWILGEHKIICGDSLQSDLYSQLMQDKKAKMILTDPPYNVKIDKNVCGLGSVKHKEFSMASGEMSSSEFTEFLTNAMTLAKEYSQIGSLHYFFMDWRHIKEMMEAGLLTYNEFKHLCIWNKDNAGMGSLYRSKHELIFIFKNGTDSHQNNVQLGSTGRYRTNVWDYPGVNSFGGERDKLELHPTVKPVALLSDAILDVTSKNDIILDPFLGSGSTLIAAQKTGRTCYGIEIDPVYVEVAITRWQEFTGNEGIQQANNLSFNQLKLQNNE